MTLETDHYDELGVIVMKNTSHPQRIFVSHNHKDAEFCRIFIECLTSSERAIWYDEYSLGWGAIRDTIQHEIATCDHFIAILSPAAVTSNWVNAEINGAIEMLRQRKLQTFALIVAEPCK